MDDIFNWIEEQDFPAGTVIGWRVLSGKVELFVRKNDIWEKVGELDRATPPLRVSSWDDAAFIDGSLGETGFGYVLAGNGTIDDFSSGTVHGESPEGNLP